MELPEILAGPILRRTEPTRVCVWIATRRKMLVEGFVYDTRTQRKVQIGRGKMISLSFGRNLFVALVQITPVSIDGEKSPPTPFPKGVLLAYDLVLTPIHLRTNEPMEGYGRALSQSQEFQDDIGISYSSYKVPTFFIPQDGSFNILHGSCRKPHGKGGDALATADRIIEENVTRLEKRPSALFLTGDQIYADDVADALIPIIAPLGFELLGDFEYIPDSKGGSIVPSLIDRASVIRRGNFIKDIFSPDFPDKKKKPNESSGKNHLLGFGDFAAMYLMTWNVAYWPKELTAIDAGLDQDLVNMRNSLRNVRRTLANIPTYMIMDDHEITDDWNITFEWERRVKASQTGRRILANGLAAYCLFQAWGNQPDTFSNPLDTFSKPLIDTLVGYLGIEKTVSADAYEAALIWPKNPKQWSFVTPTNPPVVFLDSRTRREKNQDENLPSALLQDIAIQDLVSDINKHKDGSNWLVVVAQTPIFGNPLSENYIEWKGAKNPPESVYEYDDETWHSNRVGFYNMLRALHSLASTGQGFLILSGDVHYAFVIKATVTIGMKTVPFIQFTSSALKNRPKEILQEAGLAVSDDQLILENYRLNEINQITYMRFSNRNIRRVRDDDPASGTEVTRRVIPSSGGSMPPGFIYYRQTNLGQLVLPPNGKAILNLYPPNSTKPMARYTVQLDTLP